MSSRGRSLRSPRALAMLGPRQLHALQPVEAGVGGHRNGDRHRTARPPLWQWDTSPVRVRTRGEAEASSQEVIRSSSRCRVRSRTWRFTPRRLTGNATGRRTRNSRARPTISQKDCVRFPMRPVAARPTMGSCPVARAHGGVRLGGKEMVFRADPPRSASMWPIGHNAAANEKEVARHEDHCGARFSRQGRDP
jgi:hypothetical protein